MELKRLDLQKMCPFEVCNFVPLTNECFANCKFLCTINLLSLVTQHSLPHYLAGIAEGTYYSRVNSGGGNAAATLGAHVKLCAARQQQQRSSSRDGKNTGWHIRTSKNFGRQSYQCVPCKRSTVFLLWEHSVILKLKRIFSGVYVLVR